MPCPRTLIALLVLAPAGLVARPASYTPPEARWRAWEAHQRLEQTSPYPGLRWRSIGPTVQGGRLIDIEMHPRDPYTFYVAYASGGLWKTTNNGVSFAPLSDRMPSMISGDLAIDPQNPDVLWLGTGEPNSLRSSYSGMGLFRSRDGGRSFEYVGLDFADRIARVRVDPSDSKRVFVAVQGPLYTPGGRRGVFRTRDDGATWEWVLRGEGDWTGAIDLVFDPRDAKVIYAALWERARRPWNFVEGGLGSGVYKSTDGGDTWTRLEGFPRSEHIGRIGLAISPAAPDRIYASIDHQEPLPEDLVDYGDRPLSPARLRTMSKEEFLAQDPDEIELFLRSYDFEPTLDAKRLLDLVRSDAISLDDLRAKLRDGNAALFDTDIRGIEVWRSDDAGATWSRKNAEPIRDLVYTYGYFFGEIKVAPDDADRVYIMGVPHAVSEDGGVTWSGKLNAPQVHVDHHAFAIDPNDPRRILNGNDGGLDVSYDGGATWLKLDAQAVGQSYAVGFDYATPYNVYTGMQDNGTWKAPSTVDPTRARGYWDESGDGWRFVNGGDGMQIQVDPRNPEIAITGYQFGFYRRSGPKAGEVRPRPGLRDRALRFNWQTPIQLSEHNPDILYLGANKLFRSMDQGQTWTAISPDLTRSTERGDVPYATITTLSESPKVFGLLWVGTDDGLVWVTEDGGVNWREVTRGLPKDRWVARVVASRTERNRAYVALSGYRDDDMSAYLYVTEDLGRSWRDIAKGLPAEPLNVVREDPVNPELLYVGSDRGVYVSLDRGATWDALQSGLPNVPVHDLAIHPRDRELIAGTHGRSVWIVDVLPLQDLSAEVRAKPLHVFHVDEVQFERGWRSRPPRWLTRGRVLPKVPIHVWVKNAGAVQLEIRDAKQQPVQRLHVETVAGIQRIEWDLLLDRDLALAAETRRVEESRAAQPDGATHRGQTPIAEALRLGHPLYAPPGDYELVLTQDGAEARGRLKVLAPRPFEARHKPPFELRGRKQP